MALYIRTSKSIIMRVNGSTSFRKRGCPEKKFIKNHVWFSHCLGNSVTLSYVVFLPTYRHTIFYWTKPNLEVHSIALIKSLIALTPGVSPLKENANPFMTWHGQNKKYGNFVSISRLVGKCAAQKIKNFASSSLWTCLQYIMLRSQNKITDF